MRKFDIICYSEVELVLKTIAFLLLLAGVSAMLYGNFPAQRITNCENQGVSEGVCTAIEWDSEKLNLIPKYNPENIRALVVLQHDNAVDSAIIKS